MREDHISTDNTVGSRQEPAIQDLAYIAGFLDGDGSIMVQVKHRTDTPRGWRIMVTICLYQDSRHKAPLVWIRDMLGIGYISNRNDHITELRINGYREVKRILTLLQPYIKFKKKQVVFALRILAFLEKKRFVLLTKNERLAIADDMIALRNENYQSHQRQYTDASIKEILGF
jgi:hypothetical protein